MYTNQQNNSSFNVFQQNHMGINGNNFNRLQSFGNTGGDFARDPSFNFNAMQQPILQKEQPPFFQNNANQFQQQIPNMQMNNNNFGAQIGNMGNMGFNNMPQMQQQQNFGNMGNMGFNNMPQMQQQQNFGNFGNPIQPINIQPINNHPMSPMSAQLPQQLLDVVIRSLATSGIKNIRTDSGLSIGLVDNHLVVHLSQFMSFLESLLRLSKEQAYQVSQTFLFQSFRNMGQNYFIDIEAFEKNIYSSNAPMGVQSQLINMNVWQQQRSAYDILKKVHDQVKKYIIFQNGDILKLFAEADINKDNFITLDELGYIVEKLGLTQQDRLTPIELQSLLSIFDKNGDGRISYSEMCQQFADLTNVKAIKDPNFWAYYIFQSIRSVCQYKNQSLAQMFNISGQFRGWNDRSLKIPRDQFLRSLVQNGITLSLDHEHKLFDLLQTSDSMMNGDVDFLYFSELIGFDIQSPEINLQFQNGQFAPTAGSIGENSRKFFRSINKLMLQQGLDIKNIERLLQNVEMFNSRHGIGLQGLLDINEFVSSLKNFNGSLDINLIREVGIRFSQNNLVNYKEFINTLKFEQQKYIIFNTVFSALQGSMTQYKARSLRELFTAMQPQFQNMPQIDINILENVIKNGSGIYLKQTDLQMIVLEYATAYNPNSIDFQAFERDFQEFMGQQVGQQLTNVYNIEFNNFLGQNVRPVQANIKRSLPVYSQDAMRRVALTYEQSPLISLNQAVDMFKVNPQTGSIQTQNFQNFLFQLFKLRADEIQNLVSHYDHTGRMEIRIQEFFEDLKDYISDVGKRMEIMNLTTKFGLSGGGPQMTEATLLFTYAKDIEDMIKGVLISGKDTLQKFSNYSQQPGRLTLSKMDFTGALISLELSRQLNEQDISAFFAALDLSGKNLIPVAAIDSLFKKFLLQRPRQMIEDEIIEKLIRIFNGDLNFLQRELTKIDPMGRGILDTSLFVQGIKSYLPQIIDITNKDLILIGKRYENIQFGGKFDLNQFINDIRYLMSRKGISEGIYNMHLMGNMMGGLTPAFQGGVNTTYITPGNNNSMLGMCQRNTRAEQLNPHMDQQRSIFYSNIDDQFFQDLVKATYLKGETVHKYFASKASTQDETLSLSVFSTAILHLGVNWSSIPTNNFFNQIDLIMNKAALGKVTATQLDEAVNLGCKKTIDQMSDEFLKIIREQALTHKHDFKQLVKQQDIGKNNTISVDAFVDIVLNKLKVPSLVKNDVLFLSKKYIKALPNSLSYLQLLEDFDMVSNGKTIFSTICSYIKKACLVHYNANEFQIYFDMHCTRLDRYLLSQNEFLKGCENLKLVPEICEYGDIADLFNEIDTAKTQKVTSEQIMSYFRKICPKEIRDLQEEVLDDIAQKLKTTAKGVNLDNLFKIEDPGDRAKVIEMSFVKIIMANFNRVKEVDVKLVARRYDEQGQINYKKFIQDVKVKSQTGAKNKVIPKDQKALQPGVHGLDPDSEMGKRLKRILEQINDYVAMKNIQLTNILSSNEISGGLLSYEIFIQHIKNVRVTDLTDEDIRFLAENYLKTTTTANMRGGQVVDYLKFLNDLKVHGVSTKAATQLTNEQKKVFTQLSTSIKTNNSLAGVTTSLLDSDPYLKGFLPSATLIAIFRKNGVRDITDQQFTALFTAIDKNSQGDSSYKQLLELIIGPEETLRLFSGASMGVRPQDQTKVVQFAMPISTTNAQSKMMGMIGMRLIQGGKNYEEEFRQRIGKQAAQSDQPSTSTEIVYQVIDACLYQQKLSNDERTTLDAYLTSAKNSNGLISILSLLSAFGLPPQTLGIRGTRAAPKKILTNEDRKQAQKIIFDLRKELTYLKKTPEEVFEKFREPAPNDVSIPEGRFRFAIQTSLEFGQVGNKVSDDLIRLLIYYLQQEVPGEVSFKKLYIAFAQTENQQPLQQEGIDEIKKYEQLIKEQASKGTPIEILELVNFMRQQNLGMAQIFKLTQTGSIQRTEFENALKEVGFKSRDIMKLIEVLDTKGNRLMVSLDRLNEYLHKQSSASQRGAQGKLTINMQQAREQYQGFDPKVRQILTKISENLKKRGVSINKLFEFLDANRDGVVDRDEFVNSMPAFMENSGIDMRDYAIIFTALDMNNDHVLSLNELGMFIEGAKLDKIQRISAIDPKLVDEMTNEVRQLFTVFDENRDGFITADEIKKAMMAIGRNVSMEEAQNIIRTVDQNGDGRLDQREFEQLMLQKMKEELLSLEDNVEDLRAHFLDADVDHSGTLSVNEIYAVLLKMGADLTLEELIQLMNEIDVDRNGSLDIDEFIALMTVTGNEMDQTSQKTLQSIRKSRKLNTLDFIKQFKSMPVSFIPSFLGEKWKNGKNLPASVFMPTIEPKTMLYKDMMPVVIENLPPNIQSKKVAQPKLRPQSIDICCEITFDEATGVPLPQSNEKFDRSQIVKRAVRLGLYDSLKKEYYANTAQVNVIYQGNEAEDIWKFFAMRDNSLNPVLFRAANGFCRSNCYIVFELLIYVKFGSETTEMSCGWCSLELKDPNVFQRQTQMKLPIHGGSPEVSQEIDQKDVHTQRTGLLHSIQNVFNSKIESQLSINIKPLARLDDDIRYHMTLIPQTCFIQQRLLYFVSGFRNYAAQKLLKQMAAGSMITFKQPEGDALVSTFQKVLDSPDITELFVKIWCEDFLPNLDKMNIDHTIQKTRECLRKIYPVLYAEEFGLNHQNVTASAIGDQYMMRKREELLNSALKHGNPAIKTTTLPLEQLCTFRPFSIRENDFDVWYSQTAKSDQFLQQYGEFGVIKPHQPPQIFISPATGSLPGTYPAQGFNQQTGMAQSANGFNPRNTGMTMMQQPPAYDLMGAYNAQQRR